MNLDVLIRRAKIYDGSGATPYFADVGVGGDKIVAVGSLSNATAALVLDADGLALAPGFIDPHNHADQEAEGGILNIPQADNMLRQGVTTLIAGNCGGSPWPIGEHLEAVSRAAIKQNYAVLVGYGTIRAQAVKESNRSALPDEIEKMQELACRAMDEGAIGISTGYFPSWVTTDEIVAVAEAVSEHGGLYTSHIRSEGEQLLEAVSEAIEIGRRACIPVQISHIKTYGAAAWHKREKVLTLLDEASDVEVHADRYPYTACFGGIAALVPPDIREKSALRGGLQTLTDPHWRKEVLVAVERQIEDVGGPQRVVFAPLEPNPDLDGKTLAQVAEARGTSPEELVVSLTVQGGISCIVHSMCEENLRAFLSHPLVMFGSDGHLRRLGHGTCHPRNYGTFPRAIGRYGRDLRLFDMATAIRKATGMAADKFRLANRGYVRQDYIADLVLFDEGAIIDMATFAQPHQYPRGIKYVLVNGRLAVDNERTLPGNYGRVLWKGK
jgi:N-acyl-D-amino-acid deacylase